MSMGITSWNPTNFKHCDKKDPIVALAGGREGYHYEIGPGPSL